MPYKFYNLFKRRGFGETLQLLSTFENYETLQSTFIDHINTGDSYYNAFLRVKKDLLDSGLIKYKLNNENQKMIYLTEKGSLMLKKINEIENIL